MVFKTTKQRMSSSYLIKMSKYEKIRSTNRFIRGQKRFNCCWRIKLMTNRWLMENHINRKYYKLFG